MCGLPLAIVTDGSFDYLVEANGPSASIRIIGTGFAQPFMGRHVLLSLSQRGDFLVTPVPRPGGVRGALAPSLQLYRRTFLGRRPVSFGSRRHPFQAIEFLCWSSDQASAYVLGSSGGVRGVYRIAMGSGVALPEPELVTQTDATSVEATATSQGELILSLDGQLSYERDGPLVSLRLPDNAPNPAGPLLWTESAAPTSGLL
jgi:hypothetical protein